IDFPAVKIVRSVKNFISHFYFQKKLFPAWHPARRHPGGIPPSWVVDFGCPAASRRRTKKAWFTSRLFIIINYIN
ncbi:hypothetical protein, partial [Desulfosarcina cetonica]